MSMLTELKMAVDSLRDSINGEIEALQSYQTETEEASEQVIMALQGSDESFDIAMIERLGATKEQIGSTIEQLLSSLESLEIIMQI